MSKDKLVNTSKFLSLVLRHAPETIGLKLDENGWANIDELLQDAARHIRGSNLNRELLEEIVASSDKQRFVISEDGQRIRANQGHSVAIDLALEPRVPPVELFHGTATRFLDGIFAEGLKKVSRQHVHLSPDRETALKVGQRHGKPAILSIAAAAMHADGHLFYLSDNGVWLTDQVPVKYIGFNDIT